MTAANISHHGLTLAPVHAVLTLLLEPQPFALASTSTSARVRSPSPSLAPREQCSSTHAVHQRNRIDVLITSSNRPGCTQNGLRRCLRKVLPSVFCQRQHNCASRDTRGTHAYCRSLSSERTHRKGYTERTHRLKQKKERKKDHKKTSLSLPCEL